jgi:hypothetical protein
MERRYLAFDLETAKEVPGEEFNWRGHRPLGIACAATLPGDASEPRLWHGTTSDGRPAPRMGCEDALALVEHLCQMAADGYTIVTWNGLGFDFDILAEESRAATPCKQCARDHVDLMFHVVCSLGYPVSLEKAAEGMRVPGKPAGMSGWKAPALWASGRYEDVLTYVAQDVRMALAIAQSGERRRQFEWITRKGTRSRMPLAGGWLPVREALRLPLPDTSWMSSPLSRRQFTAWLDES